MAYSDYLLKLVREGKIAEARALFEAERSRPAFAPDEVRKRRGGPPVFRCRGEEVVHDENGEWRQKDPRPEAAGAGRHAGSKEPETR